MSGTFQSRVNRYWDASTLAIAPAVFFWEWLSFVNDHPGMSFVGYGTGKTPSGTTPPAEWFNWDPETTPSPPMGSNSWFVFQADNADALLDGGGSNPWQVKIQMTLSSGFDDCNVADTSYGEEGQTYVVCIRVSPGAGWDNVTALDFSPVGGEAVSDNFNIFQESSDGKFVIDFVGDDDTLLWKGACFDGTMAAEAKMRSRGGYLGMLQRRSSAIVNPFLLTAGRIYDTTAMSGRDAIISCNTTSSYQFSPTSSLFGNGTRWPSFSLWDDSSIAVEIHQHDLWDNETKNRVAIDRSTGETVVLGILVGQFEEANNRMAIIGEYRYLGATAYDYAQHAVVGDDENWIQIAYDVPTYPGVLMRWPAGTVPIW